MDAALKEKWSTALESGEYEQGEMHLAQRLPDGNVRYCCLGVLCEVLNDAGRASLGKSTHDLPSGTSLIAYAVETAALPPEAYQAAGLIGAFPVVCPSDEDWERIVASVRGDERRQALRHLRADGVKCPGQWISLTTLNDSGVPFRTIAWVIRKYL